MDHHYHLDLGHDISCHLKLRSLYPNQEDLTGSLNFSKLLNKSLYLTLIDSGKYTNNGITPDIVLRTYSVSYNMLQIRDGLGGLVFNN